MADPRALLPGPAERSEVLRDFLLEADGAGSSFAEALTNGRRWGWPVRELLPRIEPSVEGTRFREATGRLEADAEADWVALLVDLAGSIDAAQAWIDDADVPRCWGRSEPAPPLQVARLHDASESARAARRRLQGRTAEGAPLAEIAEAIDHPLTPAWTRRCAWIRALRRRPLAEVLTCTAAPSAARDHVVAARGTVWERLVEVHRSVEPARFVELGPMITGRAPRDGAMEDRAVAILLDGAVASDVSRWEVVRMIPEGGDPVRWLEAFRRAGFDQNAAALACLDAGLTIAGSARAMARAGYDDGALLLGIRANGIGIERVVRALAADGWPRDRLVGMLQANGALLPEVWEILRTLGRAT